MKTFKLQAKMALLSIVVFSGMLVSGSMANAQQIVTTTSTYSSSCVQLGSNLWLGMYDYGGVGQVSMLQNYLVQAGYMNHAPTGYFGTLTFTAVQRFQAVNGIPSTGYVGALTRAQIQALSCQNVNPIPTPTPISTTPFINAINPTSGAVGTTVTITGAGFNPVSNTINFAGGSITNVPASSVVAYGSGIVCQNYPYCNAQQTISFTIPSAVAPYCQHGYACAQYMRLVTPGTYPVSVTNSGGTSNAYMFTVAAGPGTGSQLSILGLDAPSSLPVNNMGTWTVRVSNVNNSSLRYSVNWGDQPYASGASLPYPMSTQNSASFTHSYSSVGSFTPVFTVSDDYGNSVTASASVQITPIY